MDLETKDDDDDVDDDAVDDDDEIDEVWDWWEL